MNREIMAIPLNRHYISVDKENRITAGWSDGPHPEKEAAGAICINERSGYQFRLFPGGEENPPLHTFEGIPLYRWDGKQVQPRNGEEIEADRAALPKPPPSPMERLQAENALLKAQILAAVDRQEFLEDCMAEMALPVYAQ